MNKNALEMIRAATLAANGHNTQPWKFSANSAAIRIYPDTTRHFGCSMYYGGNYEHPHHL